MQLLPGHTKYNVQEFVTAMQQQRQREEKIKRQYETADYSTRWKMRKIHDWLEVKTRGPKKIKPVRPKKPAPNTEVLELVYYPDCRLVRSPLLKQYLPMGAVIETLVERKMPFKVTNQRTKEDMTAQFAAKFVVLQLGKFLQTADPKLLQAIAQNVSKNSTMNKSFTTLLTQITEEQATAGTQNAIVIK